MQFNHLAWNGKRCGWATGAPTASKPLEKWMFSSHALIQKKSQWFQKVYLSFHFQTMSNWFSTACLLSPSQKLWELKASSSSFCFPVSPPVIWPAKEEAFVPVTANFHLTNNFSPAAATSLIQDEKGEAFWFTFPLTQFDLGYLWRSFASCPGTLFKQPPENTEGAISICFSQSCWMSKPTLADFLSVCTVICHLYLFFYAFIDFLDPYYICKCKKYI